MVRHFSYLMTLFISGRKNPSIRSCVISFARENLFGIYRKIDMNYPLSRGNKHLRHGIICYPFLDRRLSYADTSSLGLAYISLQGLISRSYPSATVSPVAMTGHP